MRGMPTFPKGHSLNVFYLSMLQPNTPHPEGFYPKVCHNPKDFNSKLKCYISLSMCPTNPITSEKQQAQLFLKDFPEFILLESYTCERKVYRDTVSLGMGVCESDNEKAKTEIKKIARELFEL